MRNKVVTVHKFYAGPGLPQGPFLENNLFPLKVGFRWVFVNGLNWVQKWFLGAKVGQEWVKTHFKPISGFARKQILPSSRGVEIVF